MSTFNQLIETRLLSYLFSDLAEERWRMRNCHPIQSNWDAMVDIKPPKSPVKTDMELDRISNLPSDVIGNFLSHMSIREAVRTSVLSSNWMNKWTILTCLEFDDRRTSSRNHTTFASIVDHVLLGHVRPIYKFEVTLSGYQASEDIDRWIIHLSRNSIKEFYESNFGPRCA
ncbi:hypothetical protein C1H46_001968 [Malus baccata]|uniref:F-box domain-containing protein n=1 Tax=Malus baccata TaxID=106549 RepID=A0A540NMS2_MALBA|nr:hypothetical protein C1H46_001968 [Malus baccata]